MDKTETLPPILTSHDVLSFHALAAIWSTRLENQRLSFYSLPLSYRESDMGRCEALTMAVQQRLLHKVEEAFFNFSGESL